MHDSEAPSAQNPVHLTLVDRRTPFPCLPVTVSPCLTPTSSLRLPAALALALRLSLFLLKTIFLPEPKCQKWHLNPPTGPTPATRTMKVRLRTEKVTLRNDFGHSSGERDVVRISEERR